ncbi:MAG: HAD-IB family hydrolase [Burkholderiales bacterium]
MNNSNASIRDLDNSNIVAYFDFDGTITTKDTLLPFLKYTVGRLKFILKLPLVMPIGLLYLLKLITNEQAKQMTLTVMLKGYTQEELTQKSQSFAEEKLNRLIKPEVYNKLEYHLEHGHKVVLVSANLAIYLRYWAKLHQLYAVIATEIEFVNGNCSGRLATRNCYGPHKVTRINQYLATTGAKFSYSYGYGNSRGDYELLDYVNKAYWIKGKNILSWVDNNGKLAT